MSTSDTNRHSVDWCMRAAFFAGVNYDANYYFCDIDNPEDDLHDSYENWKEEFWVKEAEEWNAKVRAKEG